MNKLKKKTIGIIIFLLIFFNFIFFIYSLDNNKDPDKMTLKEINEMYKMIRNMKINEIDLSNIKDGSYKGDFNYGSFTYEVLVIIENHKYKEIKVLKNRDTKHAKKAEKIVDKVLEKQKIDIDAKTGATTTTKAFLKAIENAISNKQDR